MSTGEIIGMITLKERTFRPNQLYIDKKNKNISWSDREDTRVIQSNLDGSNIEVLIETGQCDADRSDATK
jgi:hypothetical protein